MVEKLEGRGIGWRDDVEWGVGSGESGVEATGVVRVRAPYMMIFGGSQLVGRNGNSKERTC